MLKADYRDFINRNLPLRDRACGSKSAYVSRREAQSLVRRRGFGGLYPYRCDYCPNWHLGHRRRRR